MRKSCASLLAAILLSAPAARAKTVVVRVGWEKAQAMLAQDAFLPAVRVELQSGKRLKGKLVGTTDEALRIERNKAETAIAREDIRAIRLVPRKASRQENRAVALVTGAIAGFFGGGFASAACCFFEASPGSKPLGYGVFFGAWAALQVWFYKLGLRADRGAVLLELTETAADASLSAPLPTEQTSPVEEKQLQESKATPQGDRR